VNSGRIGDGTRRQTASGGIPCPRLSIGLHRFSQVRAGKTLAPRGEVFTFGFDLRGCGPVSVPPAG
jgi:hypothetical protein